MEQIDIRPAIESQLGALLIANIELSKRLEAALAEIKRLQEQLQKES